MVGRVLLTCVCVYTCLMARPASEPLATSFLRQRLMSSMTYSDTSWFVVSSTAPLLGDLHRLKSLVSTASGINLG